MKGQQVKDLFDGREENSKCTNNKEVLGFLAILSELSPFWLG